MAYTMSMSHAPGKIMAGEFADQGKSWDAWQVFPDGLRNQIGLRTGYPIDASNLCTEVYVEAIRDIPVFSCRFRYAVSQAVREEIERIEPNVHQFIGIDVRDKTGRKPTTEYYILNICNIVSAIDGPSSVMAFRHNKYSRRAPGVRYEDSRLTISSRTVAGMAAWIDSQYTGTFVSNAVRDRIIGLGGERAVDFWEVFET